jgi:VWFA-related protein
MNLLCRLLLPTLLSIPLIAQQQPTAPPPATPTTVTLDVTVTERSGKPIPGLTQSNFTILDNGKPQQILSFSAVQAPVTDPPLQVILLIDTVNNSITNVAYEREQIATFLRKSGPTLPLPLSFIFFSDSGAEVQEAPSTSTEVLLANLKQMETKLHTIQRSGGIYAAAERVNLSLRTAEQIAAQEQLIPGRKLLIWISPGWAYLSGPNINLSAHDQQMIFANVVGISTTFERARITLYSIDPLGVADEATVRSVYYEEFLKPVPSAQKVQQGNLALQVLAVHSGGKVINTGSNIADEISSCLADASAFYVITVPRAQAETPNTLHTIQVKISDTKLQARTLFGYYAQP